MTLSLENNRQSALWWVALLLASSLSVQAQSGRPAAGGRTGQTASLTVTLTVVGSVGVVIGPDGEPRALAANVAPSEAIVTLNIVRAQINTFAATKAAMPAIAQNATTGCVRWKSGH